MTRHMEIYSFIDTASKRLFEAEKRRLETILVDINRDNKRLTKTQFDGFLYQGRYHRPSTGTLTVTNVGRTPLHESLHERMASFLRDKAQIIQDEQLLRQMLFLLLAPCQSDEQIRNTLPECLMDCVPELAQRYPRTDEPGCSIRHLPRESRTFQQLLPKLEAYSAAKLLF